MIRATESAAYEGGLADPVFGSRAVFRGLLDAFANPGRVVDLGDTAKGPPPLVPAAAAFLAALADHDTPVWFEAGRNREADAWLAFHTGAPVVDHPEAASFAVLAAASRVEDWARLAVGTSSYPDRSATLLLPVDAFAGGVALALTGPGIETVATIAPSGLPDGFVAALAANRSRFPLGFDVLLACGSSVLALPRTTRVREV